MSNFTHFVFKAIIEGRTTQRAWIKILNGWQCLRLRWQDEEGK